MKEENLDYWSDDDFEETVAGCLIGLFETKLKSKELKGMRATMEDLNRYKNTPLYIPSNSRYFIFADKEEDTLAPGQFDLVNDELPDFLFYGTYTGGALLGSDSKFKADWTSYETSHVMTGMRKVEKMKKGWQRKSGGDLYEIVQFIFCQKNGFYARRGYVSVDKDGFIHMSDFAVQSKGLERTGHVKTSIYEWEPHIAYETSLWASMALQSEADKRFCWSIVAEESGAKVELGCMKEEIKSLLYARDLPMTATGRKRPILHLVESHKRRMRNGTDIDITPFLRGSQEIIMDGTRFTVNPPKVRQPDLSENSKRYFEKTA